MSKYFQDILSSHGTVIQFMFFVSIFVISWNIENIAGVFFNYRKWRHALVNAPFIFTNIPAQFILGLFFIKVIQWTTQHHFGILYFLPGKTNSIVLFFTTFVLLDFGEYVYHLIMHKVKRLWMFHLVHHTDNSVDVSTTLREHPCESFIRLSFTLIWVFISGAAFWALLLRQIIQSFSTIFAHINFRLSEKSDRVIGLVFITPNLHQVHHHYKQPYTDCNYGDVLSIWDRLFGTFKRIPGEDLIFGVDSYMNKEENENFITLVKIPFEKYRSKEESESKAFNTEETVLNLSMNSSPYVPIT